MSNLEAAALEAPRISTEDGFADSVTIAFGDAGADVFGIARLGISGGPENLQASGLAILFADGEPIAVQAQGGVPVESEGWDQTFAAGVQHSIGSPLEQWSITFVSDDRSAGFSLEVQALGEPAHIADDSDAAKLGGMEGYEQLAVVQGEALVSGKRRRIAGYGQRGHSWGAPDWSRISSASTLTAWFEDERGVSITALRPDGEQGPGKDATAAFLLGHASQAIEDPRVSTTFDQDGRQRHAGLELYVGAEDEYPHRAAGEVICGTTLDLGRMRMDTAFMRWRMEGRTGIGRYDIVRRSES